MVRIPVLMLAMALAAVGSRAFAGEMWSEFSYGDAGFSAHFPGAPTITDADLLTTQSADGRRVERLYAFNEGGVIYSVSIVDFTDADADADLAVEEAVSRLTALGRLTLETSCYIDQMHGRELVVQGDDGTSYTDGIFWIKNHLWQIKVVQPKDNMDPAGSSGISLFQSKFQFLDPY